MQLVETSSMTHETFMTGRRCDVCGEPMSPVPPRGSRPYVTIERHVEDFDEGGTVEEFDCCQGCWVAVVRPLFKTGPNVVEY